MAYELTKDLETGNAVIDKEHRELFDAVNKLMDACSKGQGRSSVEGAINFLLDYVDRHFSHEEQLQQSSKYPGMAAHKVFHTEYKKKLKEIVSKIPASGPTIVDVGNINSHVGLLITHIKTEDKRLGAYLKQPKA